MFRVVFLFGFLMALNTNSYSAVIANTKLNSKQVDDIRKLYNDSNFFKSGVDSVKTAYLEENYPDIAHISLDKFPLLFEVLNPQSIEVYDYYLPHKEFFRQVATNFYEANMDAVDIWTKELAIEKTDLLRKNFIDYYELLISNYYLMYKSFKVPDEMVSVEPEAVNKWLFNYFDRNIFVDYFYFIMLNSDIKLFNID